MHKVLQALFPVLMVLNGVLELAMPDQFKDAMDALTMPHYMLVILGVAKIAGGFALLFPVPLFLKEWAFAGFFIWWMGGLSAHAFSGHPPTAFVLLLILGTLLSLSFVGHHKGRVVMMKAAVEGNSQDPSEKTVTNGNTKK